MIKNKAREVVKLHCTYDPDSKSGGPASNRKVKGTSHWVEATQALPVQVRIYEHLFRSENPEAAGGFIADINPDSIEILSDSLAEPGLKSAFPGERFQFLRQGYFVVDQDSTEGQMVFNRIVSLRDSWLKTQNKK